MNLSENEISELLKVIDNQKISIPEAIARIKGDSKKNDQKPNKKGFMLVVDYSRTLQEMVNAGNYVWSNDDITAKNFRISLEMTGKKVEVSAKLFHFNQGMSSKYVISKMDEAGYRPATLVELLALGEAQPDLQRKFPIIAIGSARPSARGARNFPCLYVIDGERGLYLPWCILDYPAYYHFLAVRK